MSAISECRRSCAAIRACVQRSLLRFNERLRYSCYPRASLHLLSGFVEILKRDFCLQVAYERLAQTRAMLIKLHKDSHRVRASRGICLVQAMSTDWIEENAMKMVRVHDFQVNGVVVVTNFSNASSAVWHLPLGMLGTIPKIFARISRKLGVRSVL